MTFSSIETLVNVVHFESPKPLTLFCDKAKFENIKTKNIIINFFINLYGAPGEIRTPDPLVRSQVLYPAELRAHT